MSSDIFDTYRAVRPERSAQDIGNMHITDFRQGDIIPIDYYDCIPGDRFNMNADCKVRLDPMVVPPYARMTGKVRSFFVAYRTLQKEFSKVFTGGRSGNDYEPMLFINLRYISKAPFNSLYDYFRLPVGLTDSGQTNNYIVAYYILAYIKIWNDYFRNPTLDVEIDVLERTIYYKTVGGEDKKTYEYPLVDVGNGVMGYDCTTFVEKCIAYISNAMASTQVPGDSPYTASASVTFSGCARINYDRDYFTASLPTSIHGDAPVVPIDFAGAQISASKDTFNLEFGTVPRNPVYIGGDTTNAQVKVSTPFGSSTRVQAVPSDHDHDIVQSQASVASFKTSSITDSITLDGSATTSLVWNELRTVAQLTVFKEQLNYSGSRYVDALFAIYGIAPNDKTVDRAQFIGGFNFNIITSEVLQTSETSTTPLGSFAGHGIARDYGRIGSKLIDEFGCIISCFYVNNTPLYSQGVRKDWLKRDIMDFVIPMFVNLGDKEVLTKELYYTGNPTNDNKIFGFQRQYNDYRYTPDVVTGSMRPYSNQEGWSNKEFTQARSFSTTPVLSSQFIKQDPLASDRIFADIENKPQFNIQYIAKTIAFRPIPKIANPGLIDHLGI